MKIRTGFVSNSSSSSFVLIGKPVKFEDIKFEKGKMFYAQGEADGEGANLFQIKKDDLKKIEKHNLNLEYWEVYFFGDECYGDKFDPSKIPATGAQIWCGTMSQGGSLEWEIECAEQNERD